MITRAGWTRCLEGQGKGGTEVGSASECEKVGRGVKTTSNIDMIAITLQEVGTSTPFIIRNATIATKRPRLEVQDTIGIDSMVNHIDFLTQIRLLLFSVY